MFCILCVVRTILSKTTSIKSREFVTFAPEFFNIISDGRWYGIDDNMRSYRGYKDILYNSSTPRRWNVDFVFSSHKRIGTCWQRDKKKRDQILPKVRVIAVRGWWDCGGGGGGCSAAAVKSMEQPRRRNAARLCAACSRRRDVYRFRRRYRRRDVPRRSAVTTSRNVVFSRLQQRYYWAFAAALRSHYFASAFPYPSRPSIMSMYG